jgi:hypothetical protein
MDISFSWIFAAIVGGLILFGAIYGVTKFISIEEARTSAESAVELGTVLSPLETSIESGKSIYVTTPVESRVTNGCAESGTFGTQQISIEEFIRGGWTENPTMISMESKYIFSEQETEGKSFYAFSKPFEFPFKIANLIYLVSADKKYCFVNPPIKIKKELKELNQENILFEDCENLENIEKVCFSETFCDTVVGYNGEYVKKGESTVHFKSDALMYAAIFSDDKIYECQLKRLIKKTKMLSNLYQEKALFLQSIGCIPEALPLLTELELLMDSYDKSSDLSLISSTVASIKNRNSYSKCRLW